VAKLLAVTIIVIAIASAIPIVLHIWEPPVDISVNGPLIDEQMSETMVEAGICFLVSQLVLGFFIWRFSNRSQEEKIKSFPGGARGLVAAAVIVVGLEVMALGIFGTKAWASIYFTPASPNAVLVQAQAGQFAFYFRYPGPDGKLGPIHPEQINEATENFFGLDTTHDQDSKDDIVTAELAVPVDREINLLMHAKDVGHSFFVRELRIQQDFVPGLDLSVHFTPTKIGKYEIVCTQLCGLGHFNMKAYLEVMSQEDFDKWLKQQAALQ
jgi:cytochrome c oxidase subunit II